MGGISHQGHPCCTTFLYSQLFSIHFSHVQSLLLVPQTFLLHLTFFCPTIIFMVFPIRIIKYFTSDLNDFHQTPVLHTLCMPNDHNTPCCARSDSSLIILILLCTSFFTLSIHMTPHMLLRLIISITFNLCN